MFSILFEPYPLYVSTQQRFLSSVFLGLFIAVFLIIFQPFQTGGHIFEYKNWFLAGYGLITTLVSLILSFFLKTNFLEKKWTLLRQICWLLTSLLLTTFFCYWYFIYFFQYNFSLYNLILFNGYALLIGILPLVIIALINYIFHLKKNEFITTSINKQITSQVISANEALEQTILLIEENQKDQLAINLEELLFIKASNNYVELFLQKPEKIDRILFRGNLKYVEQQITNPFIVRCHRSYIVNLTKALKTSGNAQGYRLHFNENTPFVPVSRSMGKLIMERFKSIKKRPPIYTKKATNHTKSVGE